MYGVRDPLSGVEDEDRLTVCLRVVVDDGAGLERKDRQMNSPNAGLLILSLFSIPVHQLLACCFLPCVWVRDGVLQPDCRRQSRSLLPIVEDVRH